MKDRRSKLAITIFIIVCTLSTAVFAETAVERQYNINSLQQFYFYGYPDNNDASWQNVTYTVSSGVLTTSYLTNGKRGWRMRFSITRDTIHQIDYDFYFLAVNSSISNDITQAVYVNTTNSANQVGIPTVVENGTEIINGNTYKKYHIYGTHSFNDREFNLIYIQYNISAVSTDVIIKDLKLIVNDQDMYILSEHQDWIEDVDSKLDEMTMDMPDPEDINSQIDNNIRPMDVQYQNQYVILGESHFLTTIMLMTVAFALISFILYGKKEAK